MKSPYPLFRTHPMEFVKFTGPQQGVHEIKGVGKLLVLHHTQGELSHQTGMLEVLGKVTKEAVENGPYHDYQPFTAAYLKRSASKIGKALAAQVGRSPYRIIFNHE